MRAMILKEFRELRRDHRTVAMLVVLPLLLLTIFGFAANFTVDSLTTVAVGPQAQEAADRIAASPASGTIDVRSIRPSEGRADAVDALAADRYDLAVVTSAGAETPEVLIDGTNLFAAQAANVVVAGLGDQVRPEVLFNPDLETSWVMVPALIGLILTFIGTIITSIGLVKERAAGTLEQLAVMPLRPVDVIVGKIAPYFLLAALDMAVVTALGMLIFGVPFTGSVLVFVLAGAIFLFVVLGLGVFISTVSQNAGQAIQAAILVLLPQILLSGIIFPLDAMPLGVRWIGYCLPLTYFTEVAQGVMLRGAGLDSLWLPVVVLSGMAVAVFGAAVWRFRASITPRRPRGARGSAGDAGAVAERAAVAR
ncbi:ABC transporter permease [Cellulomonas sp. C5510]|uniref:ABC transporter permease n=1 Tax=Cellulomonas sp. C5510 TaxID=2871170 RepID=UPI001C97AA4D|nr:ABC transporter permease [Cellulomonas sp. C5510]QZN85889.1 ABC transporter permease [Cellulomonas sp. C5510]